MAESVAWRNFEAGLVCNCAGRRAAQPRGQAYMDSRDLAEAAVGGGWPHLSRLLACGPGRADQDRAGGATRCAAMRCARTGREGG